MIMTRCTKIKTNNKLTTVVIVPLFPLGYAKHQHTKTTSLKAEEKPGLAFYLNKLGA
jgi:hypothetical protein